MQPRQGAMRWRPYVRETANMDNSEERATLALMFP